MITQIGYFNSIVLLISCLLALLSSKTKYKTTGIVIAVQFFIMIGYQYAFMRGDPVNYLFMTPHYILLMLLSFAFLIIYACLDRILLTITSAVIIGIFSYSIASALYGIKPLYYEQLINSAYTAHLIIAILGAFNDCRFINKIRRRNANSARDNTPDFAIEADKK